MPTRTSKTRKHFITPPADASKLEEIIWLTNLAEDIHTAEASSYLASLFTPDLIGWVSNQINNDFPPDLYDYYQGEIIKNSDLTCKLSNLQNALDGATKEFESKLQGATQVTKNLTDKVTSLELGIEANVSARQKLETE